MDCICPICDKYSREQNYNLKHNFKRSNLKNTYSLITYN